MSKQSIRNKAEIASVPRWLILGPFPGSMATPNLEDAIRNEASLLPTPGQMDVGRAWQVWAGNPVNFLDPQLGFAQTETCFAYALTYVYVPAMEKVELMAGSDDGIAIWVNRKIVHFNNAWRSMALNQDVVPATLEQGWNALLVKVSQGNGEWVFNLQISRKAPSGGMKFTLNRTIIGLRTRAGKGADTLALMSSFEKSRLIGAPDGWALQMRFQLFNDSARRADRLNVAVVDASGQPCGKISLPSLKPFGSLETTIALSADKLFRALAENGKVRMCANATLGSAELDIGSESMTALFVNAMAGIDVSVSDGFFVVPKCFRGQSAILEVQSQKEMHNRILASPAQRVWRDIPAKETASGRVNLKLDVPPAIADPVRRLTFGGPSLRDMVKRAQCLIMDLKAGSSEADRKAIQGLRALAEGNFSATARAMQDVYRALAENLPDRSGQQITLVGHAHIDMNWLWDTAETKKVTHDTFRQVLVFMKEFPQFTFSQSQASTYQFIERLDPPMFEQIRHYVKEGRWELLGGMIDEGDTNLAGGEALARTLLSGQRYFLSRFGKMAVVGWLPDNFGHIAQLPQMLRLAGMSAFYGHRCQPKEGPHIWEGADGTRVINYSTPTYNGEITSNLHLVPEQYDPEHKKLLWVYGVGDHGGGPTRHDITRAVFYNTVPGFPKIRFGTAAQFFESLKDDTKDYPVYRGERQYIYEGCYTSIARIKTGNRRCENMLYIAELLNALMAIYGHVYPRQLLAEAWHTVAFHQFHDILCGSAVHESNETSIAAYHMALDKAEEARYSAMRFLAANVPTDPGRGQPVVVFNPCPMLRTDVAEVELFSYHVPPTARLNEWSDWLMGMPESGMKAKHISPLDIGHGPLATLAMTDQNGRPVDAQIIAGKRFPNGWRMKVRFLSTNMPACGWRVFYAKPAEPGVPTNSALKVKGTTIETPWLKVQVDPRTGHVTRIYDKHCRKEVLARGAKGNVLKIYMEKPHGMSAWNLGPISQVHTLDKAEQVRVTESGPVRATIEVWRKWNRSLFIQRIHVYRDLPRVEFEIEAHWFEQGGPTVDSPMLRVAFPVNIKKGRFFCDTPFAAVERPIDGREVPAQKWVDLSNAAGGVVLLNDSKYGHRCDGNVLEITLLRASYEPDPYPDQGPHTIRYAILPHAGEWRKAQTAREGLCFNAPMPAIETPPNQRGRLPEAGGLMSLSPDNIQLSGVKRAEDDNSLIVRFYESSGKATMAALTLPRPIRSVKRVNLLEQPLASVSPAEVKGNTIRVAVRPHEIVTLKVRIGAQK